MLGLGTGAGAGAGTGAGAGAALIIARTAASSTNWKRENMSTC